jgi:hypothetical protein
MESHVAQLFAACVFTRADVRLLWKLRTPQYAGFGLTSTAAEKVCSFLSTATSANSAMSRFVSDDVTGFGFCYIRD